MLFANFYPKTPAFCELHLMSDVIPYSGAAMYGIPALNKIELKHFIPLLSLLAAINQKEPLFSILYASALFPRILS